MQVARRVAEVRAWRAAVAPGRVVSFVPTMGALHEGHASLVRHARRVAGEAGKVAASIFVNPTQFAPHEDLARYPRTPDADMALLEGAGADMLFTPTAEEMYGPGGGGVTVDPGPLGQVLEGAFRPTHFRGVCTVVLKLLEIVQPTTLLLGQKDYQQQAVVRQMLHDLNVPVDLVVSPTVRDADGLALSSRNRYLSPAQRRQAPALFAALTTAAAALHRGDSPAQVQAAALATLQAAGFAPHYIAICDRQSLQPLAAPAPGTAVILAAALLGDTRLIDNVEV